MRAGAAVSNLASSAPACQAAAAEAVAALGGGRADAAVVFATREHAHEAEAVLRAAQEITGASSLVGCAVSGLLSRTGECESGPALGVMVLAGVRAEARLLPSGPLEVAGDVDIAVALVDPRLSQTSLFGDAARVAPLVGAGASAEWEGAVVGAGGRTLAPGAAVLELRGVRTFVATTTACTPMTPSEPVTRSHGPAILAIGGRPAAQRFLEAAADPLIGDPRRATSFVYLAVGGELGRRPRRGEYYVRPVVGLNRSDGTVVVGEEVPEGTPVTFALREAIAARRDLAEVVDQAIIDLPGAPRAALYFNCGGRGSSLYGGPNVDVAVLNAKLPGVPLLGMFSAFEIGPAAGRTRLLMQTGILALLCDPA